MPSHTRDRILMVAARLFEARGFEGTPVAAILREADVNSGSLYHFFTNKEELLVAVLARHVDGLEGELLARADDAAVDPLEKVFALLELYRGRLRVSDCTRGCPVGDLSHEVAHRVPEARALIDRYFAQWTARVAGWLGDAGERLPAPLDPHSLAVHVLSAVQGGLVQARAAGTVAPFDDTMSQLRLLLDLAGAGGAPRTAADDRTERSGRFRRRARPEVVEEAAAAIAGSARDEAVASKTEAPTSERDAWWRAW